MEIVHSAEHYDVIAREVFFPLFAQIAESAVHFSCLREKCRGGEAAVLDVGCGGGMFGYHIARLVPASVTFLDINTDALEIARRRGAEWGLLERCSFVAADVKEIPLPDASFDLIVSRGTMGFWGGREEVAGAMAGLYRLLKPGGVILTGHSLGTPEVHAKIVEEMKTRQPGWPSFLKNVTSGLDIPDFVDCANTRGLGAAELKTESGHWVYVRKEAL